jgi:acylphosphatase
MIARRFIIKGRVQGVGYRYYAVRAARKAGVVGQVRNMRDGSVEVTVEGSARVVGDFREDLARGPSFAEVISIEEVELAPTGRYTGFDVVF